MIPAIIVEDEQHCSDRLISLLKAQATQTVQVMATCRNIQQAVDGIQQYNPGLVFLDVQLQHETGFDLLQQLHAVNFEVIFTTAYEKYAVQAFKFSALDYLLKPIDADDLEQALARLKEKTALKETAQKLEVLFYNLKDIQGAQKRICVPVAAGFVFLQVSDIIRCESSINYTTFFLKDKKTLMVAKTLKEFEALLGEYNFFRVHNSHLVNLAYIKSYNKGKDGFITMTDGSKVDISTRRKDEFLRKVMG